MAGAIPSRISNQIHRMMAEQCNQWGALMPTIAMIQNRVAVHFDIPSIDMRSRRNARKIARPRQIAMYLARQMTVFSLPQIGAQFGNRDHTTVMWAVERVKSLMDSDSDFLRCVQNLRLSLEAPVDAL